MRTALALIPDKANIVWFATLLSCALGPVSCSFGDDSDLAGLIGTQFVPLGIDTADVDGTSLTTISLVAPPSWLTAVKREFGAQQIKRVELSKLTIKVNSPNVPDWSYLWSGEVTVAFVPASSPSTRIVVAHGTPPSSFALFEPTLSVTNDTLDVSPDFANGNFEIQVTGPTNRLATDSFQQQAVIEMEIIVF